jgi:hypothetical protein
MIFISIKPKGPTVNSQGRQPLVRAGIQSVAPRGRKGARLPTAAPLGLARYWCTASRGSRPWLFTVAALRLQNAFSHLIGYASRGKRGLLAYLNSSCTALAAPEYYGTLFAGC